MYKNPKAKTALDAYYKFTEALSALEESGGLSGEIAKAISGMDEFEAVNDVIEDALGWLDGTYGSEEDAYNRTVEAHGDDLGLDYTEDEGE